MAPGPTARTEEKQCLRVAESSSSRQRSRERGAPRPIAIDGLNIGKGEKLRNNYVLLNELFELCKRIHILKISFSHLAMDHGLDKVFSVEGISIAVTYFLR